MPEISFLIPALNEEKNIGSCIESIKDNAALLPSWEIVVGDHGSSDRTIEVAKSAGATVVSHPRGTTIASLRNFLVSSASGRILIFIDADVHLTELWRKNIVDALSELETNRRQITGSWCSVPDVDNMFIESWFGIMPTENRSYIGTGHIVFTRELFEKVGGFDAVLRTGEDYDFCARAKSVAAGVINSNPLLKVIHHDYPLNWRAFVAREKWHGVGDFQSVRNILKSKIALVCLSFIALHFALIVALIAGNALCLIGAALALALLLIGMSVYKFHNIGLRRRVNTIYIYYLYFIGRSLSFFS